MNYKNILKQRPNFVSNKYSKYYLDIVDNIINENRSKLIYIHEYHHILPKSIFPEYEDLSTNSWNKLIVTKREHFILHLLLLKIWRPGTTERQQSAFSIHQMKRIFNDSERKINSKIFEIVKKEHSLAVSKSKKGNSYCKGKKTYHDPENDHIIRIDENLPIPHGYVPGFPQSYKDRKKTKTICHDPITGKEIQIDKNELLPDGYLAGRSSNFVNKVKKSSIGNKSNKNKIKCHNPKTGENKHWPKGEKLPEGFILGVSPKTKEKLSQTKKGKSAHNKGTIRCYNSETNKVIQLPKGSPIPAGYKRGMGPNHGNNTSKGMMKSPNWQKELIRRSPNHYPSEET